MTEQILRMPTQRFIRLPVPTAQFGQEIRYRELRWLYATTRDAIDERDIDQVSQTEAIRRRVPLRMEVMTQAQAARLFPVGAGALIP